MLDRATIAGSYDESGESDRVTLTALEMQLVRLFRRMSDEDRQRVRRMSELLSEVPDVPDIGIATA